MSIPGEDPPSRVPRARFGPLLAIMLLIFAGAGIAIYVAAVSSARSLTVPASDAATGGD